jgi:hypothetical protein
MSKVRFVDMTVVEVASNDQTFGINFRLLLEEGQRTPRSHDDKKQLLFRGLTTVSSVLESGLSDP